MEELSLGKQIKILNHISCFMNFNMFVTTEAKRSRLKITFLLYGLHSLKLESVKRLINKHSAIGVGNVMFDTRLYVDDVGQSHSQGSRIFPAFLDLFITFA